MLCDSATLHCINYVIGLYIGINYIPSLGYIYSLSVSILSKILKFSQCTACYVTQLHST